MLLYNMPGARFYNTAGVLPYNMPGDRANKFFLFPCKKVNKILKTAQKRLYFFNLYIIIYHAIGVRVQPEHFL